MIVKPAEISDSELLHIFCFGYRHSQDRPMPIDKRSDTGRQRMLFNQSCDIQEPFSNAPTAVQRELTILDTRRTTLQEQCETKLRTQFKKFHVADRGGEVSIGTLNGKLENVITLRGAFL
jgi:hypothetical protein